MFDLSYSEKNGSKLRYATGPRLKCGSGSMLSCATGSKLKCGSGSMLGASSAYSSECSEITSKWTSNT